MTSKRPKIGTAVCAVLVVMAASPAVADGGTQHDESHVELTVVPIASMAIVGNDTLDLTVPPSKSTVNTSNTVQFVVVGNAVATVSASPNEFIDIPGTFGGWMGKAVNGSSEIGYQLQLTFPSNAIVGSNKQVATLPLSVEEGTPPLSVDLTLSGGQRYGAIDLLASAAWTPDGALPAVGLYQGQVTLTVTASNL